MSVKAVKEMTPHISSIIATGLVNTTYRWLLVDLSDITNFPHKQVNAVVLKSLQLNLSVVAAAVTVRLGVITENDDSDGSVVWIWEATQSEICCMDIIGEHNQMDLSILDSVKDQLAFIKSNKSDADDANWDNVVGNLRSPFATDASPGPGDFVAEVVAAAGANATLQIVTGYNTI